jgi:hypothetical protein
MSEGTIGEISAVLAAAAIYAIQTKSEIIGMRALDNCDYVSPSARRHQSV